MDVKSHLSDSEGCTLIHEVRVLEKIVIIRCYVKDIRQYALQEKKEVVRGSVWGIFQIERMTGIEVLKCRGPEDETGQRIGQKDSNPSREPQQFCIAEL